MLTKGQFLMLVQVVNRAPMTQAETVLLEEILRALQPVTEKSPATEPEASPSASPPAAG